MEIETIKWALELSNQEDIRLDQIQREYNIRVLGCQRGGGDEKMQKNRYYMVVEGDLLEIGLVSRKVKSVLGKDARLTELE